MPDTIPMEEAGEYRQRVRSLERGQDQINAKIDNLGNKIDEKFGQQKPQWSVIIAASSLTFIVLSGLITLITVPILAILVDLKTADKEIRAEVKEDMSRGRDARTLEIRDMKLALMQDIRDIREDLVPRKEHATAQATLANQLADLSRRISEVREDYKDLFSARDIINKLVNDVSALQRADREKN